MNQLSIPAYAKINLTLDVLGKRPDGYHEVEMIMQSIELHDQIILKERKEKGIKISCNHPLVPQDEGNLAYRAAELLIKEYGIEKGIEIKIIKNIPVAAGLAGGSTDAAGVLKGLNELWGLGISRDELMKFGARLGADIPFCILGGTAIARGIGTDLTPISPLPEMELVLVKPGIDISTKEIYSKYKPELVKRKPDLRKMQEAIECRDLEGVKRNLVNVLEDITLYYYPQVAETKKIMENLGTYPVLMSGSGPTLFAIIDSKREADEYAMKLKDRVMGQVIRTRTRSECL
ncbi:4-(cytidine 5'-diphospho)-2-C-methyl-D-erythritol kinase [Anoxybacter fermentans]|uniref:4-diphosphocytidyl-2-C-methyl-D-erythritol kinase n=1 Tax=Anoxybacter fermentans TaxID=1323375 RepID=A0A3Q9HS59_9FIRM|nr:4-(cytidine 5'-diphospho)-2-C-methyl-D-erythritol kinase [Anoxybacter fermentans]AZR74524.1 4-(cytidine 5'-diphospho)-2-C-methyl-D-erythritol kinase [Anoxybacter fermentans]